MPGCRGCPELGSSKRKKCTWPTATDVVRVIQISNRTRHQSTSGRGRLVGWDMDMPRLQELLSQQSCTYCSGSRLLRARARSRRRRSQVPEVGSGPLQREGRESEQLGSQPVRCLAMNVAWTSERLAFAEG